MRLGEALISALSVPCSFSELHIIAGFCKRSGVSRIRNAVINFRNNGGTVKAVVGVDARGTSKEGLEMLFEVCDEVFVFHDENRSQTFHPKIYILSKHGDRAIAYVGSSNLTMGGLFSNYETNVRLELDLSEDDDLTVFREMTRMFSIYSDPSDHYDRCRRLTSELIDELDTRGYLGGENSIQIGGATESEKSESGDSRLAPLFGHGQFPHVVTTRETSGTTTVDTMNIEVTRNGFWKRLSNYDASRTSSPGQMIIPMNYLADFPDMTSWTNTQSGGKQADAFFNVIFVDKDHKASLIRGARAIFYVPAPHHPRPNREIRFTFRNHEILELLKTGDILEFRRTSEPDVHFVVSHLNEDDPRFITYSNTGKKSGLIS